MSMQIPEKSSRLPLLMPILSQNTQLDLGRLPSLSLDILHNNSEVHGGTYWWDSSFFFMKEVTRGIIFNFLPSDILTRIGGIHTPVLEEFEETNENGNKKQRFLVDGTTKNGEV